MPGKTVGFWDRVNKRTLFALESDNKMIMIIVIITYC